MHTVTVHPRAAGSLRTIAGADAGARYEQCLAAAREVLEGRSVWHINSTSAGGGVAELLNDVSVRVSPVTDLDAAEMIHSLATYPRLDGYRGAPKADVPALEELVLRVSAMAEMHPEIVEMDCNPVKILRRGTVIVDARVRIEPVGSGHEH